MTESIDEFMYESMSCACCVRMNAWLSINAWLLRVCGCMSAWKRWCDECMRVCMNVTLTTMTFVGDRRNSMRQNIVCKVGNGLALLYYTLRNNFVNKFWKRSRYLQAGTECRSIDMPRQSCPFWKKSSNPYLDYLFGFLVCRDAYFCICLFRDFP